MSALRRKVVVMASVIAIMGGAGLLVEQRHPELMTQWIGILMGLVLWTIVEMVRLKRAEPR